MLSAGICFSVAPLSWQFGGTTDPRSFLLQLLFFFFCLFLYKYIYVIVGIACWALLELSNADLFLHMSSGGDVSFSH